MKHHKNIHSIPIRIHVNGSRGKSSVTRLIAAGLREGGIVTCAKTTGTLPRFILPNGTEESIYRPTRANILEQIKIFQWATRYHPQAIVIECMALQPQLQSICELKLVKSSHGVITNVRKDHLDVMGPLETDVAWALAGTTPINGTLFTTEQKHFKRLALAAHDRHSDIKLISKKTINSISEEELSAFSYKEHRSNIALALQTCEHLGIPRSIALHGMQKVVPDIGALTINKVIEENQVFIFANGFAANDPTSSEQLWDTISQTFSKYKTKIALINCRADRKDRSIQLAKAISTWTPPDIICLVGTGIPAFLRIAKRKCDKKVKIIDASLWKAEELTQNLLSLSPPSPIMLVGLGNISGIGLQIVEYFRNHDCLERKK